MTLPGKPPTESPAEQGFAMPAEWSPHAATWLSWPFDNELWAGNLDRVRIEFAALVATIARFEPVVLNVKDDATQRNARTHLSRTENGLDNVTFHPLPLDDSWFRDNGPMFVKNSAGQVALVDWSFNAWGETFSRWDMDDRAPQAVAQTLGMKRFSFPQVMEGGALEVNARGVCLTTRACLLSEKRNPTLTQGEIEQVLRDALGITQLVWLEAGLEGDHTDGHVDMIARFTDDRTIVCAVEEDEDDTNFETMQRNFSLLRTLRDAEGTPYSIVELPLPQKRVERDGVRVPLSYANFYIGNGFVVVPIYDDANDARALEILRPLFPNQEVIGLDASYLITGGGAFHCVTQQQPVGEIYKA